MKHNLKNRPIIPLDPLIPEQTKKVEKWFEGFEKELRKHLQAFIDENTWPECSEFYVDKTVKEILGE